MTIDKRTTAYAESVSSNSLPPSYITAADTLSIANNNKTFIESASDTVEAIPKFIASSLISGANQLYNVPASIGNMFGGDFELSDTQEVVSSLSSDLGQFYKENQAGADLVGFLVSSVVPGSAAVKVLNAGQKSLQTAISAGKFGSNIGKGFGLLALPGKQQKLAKAIGEATSGNSAAGILSKSSLRSMGAGLHQGALEALAFETAVTATLFNSPILENQDLGDFVFNVAFGAGAYGLVSGAIDATRLNSAIKKGLDNAALEARPYTFIDEAAEATERTSDKIVLDYAQRDAMPPVIPSSDAEKVAKLTEAAKTKRNRLDNRIRKEYGTLAQGDEDVAEVLYNKMRPLPVQQAQSSLIGLEEVTKLSTSAPKAKRAEQLQKKMATGKATVDEIDEFAQSNVSVKYMRTWGEGVGEVLDEAPVITNLVDTLGKGQVIKVTRGGVTAGKRKYKFAQKDTSWDIRKVDALEANARYMWAHSLDKLAPTAKKPLTVNVNDIPMMEKVMVDLGEEGIDNVRFTGLDEGEQIGTNLQNFISDRKLRLANELTSELTDAAGKVSIRTQDEIASIVNIKSSVLSGDVLESSVSKYNSDDMFALQNHAEGYTKELVSQGLRRAEKGPVDITKVPQTVKLTYDSTDFVGINNHVVENMAVIKQQQKLYQDGTGRAVAGVLGGEDFARLQDINSGQVFNGALPSGAGAGFVSAANANYGTLAASVQDIGKVTSDIIGKFRDRSRETLEPLLFKLGNNSEATAEWSTLQQRVRSIEGNYGINEVGDALEPLELIRWRKAAAEASEKGQKIPDRPVLSNPEMPARIDMNTQEVRDLARAHVEVNGARTNGLAAVRTSQGTQFNRAPDAFYPIPVNPKDFPFFAMVSDRSITSGNQSKTLFARTEQELGQQITKLKQNPQLEIRTKLEAEEYFKSQGTWDYEKTLNNNYLDVEAHRKGVSAPFLVSTDPEKVTKDMLNWHMDRETGLVRESVAAKYEVQFEEMMRLGDEFTNTATSRFGRGDSFRDLEDVVKNPFANYIKTALGIRNTSEYPWWVTTNRLADQAFTKMYRSIDNLFTQAKSPNDLLKINQELEKAGYKGAHYDEQMELFANATPNKGALNTVIQKANAVMATVVLRWDALNAVNNAVSHSVLLGAETAAVQRAIARGDTEAAGALADLTRVKVPGTEETIMAPQRLIANSIKKFGTNTPEMQYYRDNGYITSISKQYQDTLDSLTFNPNADSVASWGERVDGLPAKLRKAGDFGEVVTGNKLAEEFNRFVAADVMKQMTDVAVKRDLMSKKEQLAYINTFVNRTQGNYLASQRPTLFAGPIGQAVGLFQTYQFNLMQQMLRHVGEGAGKDTATLLALQGSIHGMNGLPGFNAVNTHLIGTASGNTEHKDIYSETYGAVGKEAGDWLMYGAASNTLGLLHPELKINLYTRGDINPRHVTLVPTDPASIPAVQAGAKVFKNLFDTAKQLGQGADVTTTLLRGLEHNGLSRPLAGLAQTLQGVNNPQQASYSTTKRGNVIAANDFLSLTNLGRIAGGKPLDEAIAIDATYRYKAYAAKDAKKRQVLGESIKSTLIAGQEPSLGQIENFAQQYAETGGRQEEFGQFFTQLYKNANVSQSNKLQQNLRSPFSQRMQELMGGRELQDFSATVASP